MPRRGRPAAPKISAGDRVTRTAPPPMATPAGRAMLPVPRTTLASVLKSQTAAAPAKTTLEYATAAARAPSRAPMAWYSGRPPVTTTAVNTPPRASAMTIAWATSASAWARRPAPRARHRRGDAAAHAAGRHRLHQHDERERHRDPGQRVGAEPADEVRLQHVDG